MKRLIPWLLLVLSSPAIAQQFVLCTPTQQCTPSMGVTISIGDQAPRAFGEINANFLSLESLGLFSLQPANEVFIGPTGGAAAAPTWRFLVPADIPTNISISGNAATATALAATPTQCNSANVAVGIQAHGTANCTNTVLGPFTFVGPSTSADALEVKGSATSGSSNGLVVSAGFVSGDVAFGVLNQAATSDFLLIKGSGSILWPTLASATAAQSGYLCYSITSGQMTYDPTNTCLASSIRYKQQVLPLDEGLGAVMRLRPVSYELKPQYNPSHLGRQVGLIAEDVQKIDSRLTPLDEQGLPRGVEYDRIVVIEARAIQQQQHEIEVVAAAVMVLIGWNWHLARTLHRRLVWKAR